MATTKIQSGAFPADVVNSAAIDDLAVTHAKLHTTMDLSSKTVTLPTLSTLDVSGTVTADGLNVQNGSNAGITFDLSTNYTPVIKGSQAVSDLYLEAVGGGGFRVSTTDKPRLFIQNNGDVSFYEDTGVTAKFFWDASTESLQLGGTTNIQAQGSNVTTFGNNFVLDGGYKYLTSGAANMLYFDASGNTMFFKATSGTSGNAVSFSETMRIDSSGNIKFGPNGEGYINGSAQNTYNSGFNVNADDWSTWINYSGYQGGTTKFRDLVIGNGKGSRIATIDGSSGNVGIGVTPSNYPGYRTIIKRDDNTAMPTSGISNEAVLALINDSTTLYSWSNLVLRAGTGDAGIAAVYQGSANNSDLILYTDGGNNGVERMRIKNNGDVGIGTTAPSAKLHTVKATSDTITAATAGVKFDGSGSDGLAFGNMASAPHSSWIQAGYLANGYSPAFNSGYPIALNPIGGNVGIGITNPSEELHIYDAGSDPYVLVDGSGSNRDSGYKINAGNGVKIAARADSGGNMYFADNTMLVGSSNGNGTYRSVKIDSEICLRENSGTNPSEAILARMLGCRDVAGAGGAAIISGQGDTLSGYALRKLASTGNNTFFFGPYGTFPAGSFTALFRIKINVINASGIGQVDVTGSGTANPSGPNVTNRSRSVSTSDFTNGQYRYIPVDFDRTTSGGSIEFRYLNANTNADMYLDHILIVPRIVR